MKIYCDRQKQAQLQQWQSEKDAYIADYNARKARYDEQQSNFGIAFKSYTETITDKIENLLKDDITNLPNLGIKVEPKYDYYRILIYNQSSKYRGKENYNYPRDEHYYALDARKKGFNWTLSIQFIKMNDGTVKVNLNPRITADLLEADDLVEMQATYNLMLKIQTIDWESWLNKITAEIPKRPDYVTEPDPGTLDTSEFDKKINLSNVDDLVGKDVWFLAKYKEYGNSDSRKCLIQLTGNSTSSKAYYRGHIYSIWGIIGGNLPIKLGSRSYSKTVERTHDIRKKGITIIEPLQCFTTEELFELDPTNSW